MSKKISHADFVKRAKVEHGSRYNYNESYHSMSTKLSIICKHHGVFKQTPNNHLRGQGCPVCGGSIKRTISDFIRRAIDVHGDRYDYSHSRYTNSHSKININCNVHGIFSQNVFDHLNGSGCPKCANKHKYTTAEFIEKSNNIHRCKYDYLKTVYKNWNTKISIKCPIHGYFMQVPNNHLRGHGCPRCAIVKSKNYSLKAIKWLDSLATDSDINIRHALNGGEYIIPHTNLKVDGFYEKSNTVYEFYGDAFHGNLNIFGGNYKCHPYDKNITAKELFEKTQCRELKIKDMGYNIVTIWENEWDKIKGNI